MTILPKKKLTSNKNDDGSHADSERAHHPHAHPHSHSHAHGHRDRMDHGMVGHMQRSEDGRLYVSGPSGGACWQPRDDKRQVGLEPDSVDGPSHVKRRHRDVPRNRLKQTSRIPGPDRPVGVGVGAGACGVGVPSCSRLPSSHSSASSSPHDDVSSSGGSSPIAGPSGFKPATSARSRNLKPLSSPSRPRGDESEGEEAEALNSDDEYERIRDEQLTEDDWREREEHFEKLLQKKNLVIKQMEQDGACLFRAVADQVYGDQEMHGVVRAHCMDYVAKNADFFSEYITEDFESYVSRKRLDWVHGNNVEIQALSEMYNRPIEVYSYSASPINTFHGEQQTDNPPIRLSYHRHVHYNSVVDPWAPTIGVGLGLPGYKPGTADKKLMNDAMHQSENTALEQAMLEDKLKATDWEATDEAIEEQVARESYLQWLRDNEKRALAAAAKQPPQQPSAGRGAAAVAGRSLASPKPGTSSRLSPDARQQFSAGPSTSKTMFASSFSPNHSSSPVGAGAAFSPPPPSTSSSSSGKGGRKADHNFAVDEAASFLNDLPPEMFGLSDFEDNDSILARVLAASQEEYLNSLKKNKPNNAAATPGGESSSSDPPSAEMRDADADGDGEGDGQAREDSDDRVDDDDGDQASGYDFRS